MLGECALVDYNSPISLSNKVYYTTLFDENASCHIALGEGFKECTKDGYDIELTRTIADSVSVPVIASGGAGTKEHFLEALTEGHAEAALAASLFHYKELTISDVKQYLKERGVNVRCRQ